MSFSTQQFCSLHSNQVSAAKLTQPLARWMRKFKQRKNKEIALPVFVLQNDESVRVWVIFVTSAVLKLPRIRFSCVRECEHVCELGHIQFSTPHCGRDRKTSSMNHSWWRQGAEMDKWNSREAGVEFQSQQHKAQYSKDFITKCSINVDVLLFPNLCWMLI